MMNYAIGSLSIIAVIAAVFFVAAQHMLRPPLTEASYHEDWDLVTNEKGLAFTARPTVMIEDRPQVPKAIPIDQAKIVKAVPVTAGIQDIEAKRSAIGNVLKAFFEAPDLESKLAYVRMPRRVQPLMEKFYAEHSMTQLQWRGIGKMLSMDEPGFRFGYVQADFQDGPLVPVLIEETAQQGFLIDWESLVRYSEISWNEFLKQKPTSPRLIRLIASRPRDVQLSSAGNILELRHPKELGSVRASFDLRSPKYSTLLQQLEARAWSNVPLTLRLNYTNKGQVEIASVEGKGWVILHNAP
jgi:hypothetical protein